MAFDPDATRRLRRPRSTARVARLAVVGLAVFATFVALGTWQVHRYHWKSRLIAEVTQRAHASPTAAPGPPRWSTVTARHDRYLHVRLHGHFLPGKMTLVHGSSRLGYGFWVMAPLQTARGFMVLVNRGYISTGEARHPHKPLASPHGQVTLTGLLRLSEPGGGFLRPNHPRQDRWYSRDVAAIAKAEGLPADRVAPYFVDADAGQHAGHWPVGGLTKIHFYNESLVYAITWYIMAALTLLGGWIVGRHEWQTQHRR